MRRHKPTRTRTGAKRLLLTVAVAVFFGAVAALVSSTTFGFFSASHTSSSSSFTTGTVTQSRSAGGDCTVSDLLPDGLQHTCGTLGITYGGSVDAFLAVDVLIETTHASGGTDLYNPGGSGGLAVTISSTSPSVTSYSVPDVAHQLSSCPIGAPVGATCYELADDLVSLTPFTNASGPVTFTTKVSIPTSSPTGYQGGTAKILLTVHAAQSGNNALPGGCTTAGQSCPGANWN